jgi:hypothetical protein
MIDRATIFVGTISGGVEFCIIAATPSGGSWAWTRVAINTDTIKHAIIRHAISTLRMDQWPQYGFEPATAFSQSVARMTALRLSSVHQ